MKIQKRLRVFAISRVSYWPRIALTVFAALAVVFLGAQLANPNAYGGMRIMFLDATRPILAAWSSIGNSLAAVGDGVANFAELRSENEKLTAENERLRTQELLALKLSDENRLLRQNLHVVPDAPAKFVTVRVISDSGSGMVRSLIVNAGRAAGIKKGHVALVNGYFVGRVQEVSDQAARVVLITDYNSRIPVIAGDSALQGILNGDNSNVLKLLYISQPQMLAPGAAVLTSGKGGGLPPGLPVGRIQRWDGTQFRVVPMIELADLRFLQIVDYGLSDMLSEFDAPDKRS